MTAHNNNSITAPNQSIPKGAMPKRCHNSVEGLLFKKEHGLRLYSPFLSASENRKGVLEVDSVKGCTFGMSNYKNGGCYDSCYAASIAKLYGIDFSKSISRKITGRNANLVYKTVKDHNSNWYRVGVSGDPSHDWDNTIFILDFFKYTNKTPVIVTKHWVGLSEKQIKAFKLLGAVFNTSISAMDSYDEIEYRLSQHNRLNSYGLKSVLRVVTCDFGDTERGNEMKQTQERIVGLGYYIDTPFRANSKNKYVANGDVLLKSIETNTSKNKTQISLHCDSVYVGHCSRCKDQCGVKQRRLKVAKEKNEPKQELLFKDKIEYIHIESVIGSGYEEDVAKLAIEDKVAYRAARKNMQIHSAIILKINSEFSGFFTFQVNHEAKEFCLLQSAMVLDRKDKEIYSGMVNKIIEQNTYGYPMVFTCSKKHDLEKPEVFEAIGFKTYLLLSGFAYMVYGALAQVRMKRLAHATMTNAWVTTRADWLKMKKEWNTKIEAAGEKHNIPNPKFASRDGCWQGSNGYSNVVLTEQVIEDGEVKTKKGKSFNGNASVLDPVACEAILRFCMPTNGKRVYNPFGGGVQFGFIAGSYGYEYIASEIRQNQCDANNAICKDLKTAKWIKSDSSKYTPKGKFDLCFTCPPYYKVEKYIDYDGVVPDGELNDLPTYDKFRDTLFDGYKRAIDALDDNRFFVVMTGDSRDKNGAYYGCEAEHELFFKEQGLHIYNKIVYLECEFTRLAHAKRTLDYRKFPKREQKILMFFKGDMKTIKDNFPKIGRL